jgi:hypothetical protein
MSESSAIFSVVVFILPVCLSAHLMIEPLGIIDYLDLVFSYTNIWLKDSILYRIVKVNMVLTKKGFYVRIVFFCILKQNP